MEWTRYVRSTTMALALLSWSSPATAALVIDTFSGSQSATDTLSADGASVTSNAAVGSVFGGQRRLVANKSGPFFPLFAPLSLSTDSSGSGLLTFDQDGGASGVYGTAALIYDGNPAGSGTTVNPTFIADTDFTINGDRFVLRDLAVFGSGIDLTINVYDDATVSTFTTELADNPTPTDFFINFDAFSDPNVFTSVNAIALTFDGLPDSGSLSGRGSDLSFSSLGLSTPEPSGLAMMGLACAGLFLRRCRRRTYD